MKETKTTAKIQVGNADTPEWLVHYNHFMPILEDSIERLWKIRNTHLEYMRELDKFLAVYS